MECSDGYGGCSVGVEGRTGCCSILRAGRIGANFCVLRYSFSAIRVKIKYI